MNILDCSGISADRKFRQLESISLERYSIAPRPSLLRRIIAQILRLCKVPSFLLHHGIRSYKYKTGGRVSLLEGVSLKALFSWISSTWHGSDLCAEYAVSATLDNGQRVVGRIDLLIRTADGPVVMDHKLAGMSEGSVEEIVATWAPQLALYATAIARISGKPPAGTWLNLPLEGSAVRVMGAV